MKLTLKDYQEDAVAELLRQLRKARRRWQQDGDRSSISLSATTGAGKTVMAAAALEALFYGDDTLGFEADPGAVVIWFSDDPSLNEQSQSRLRDASDRLDYANLVTIETSFAGERLEPGKVYFLNTQKLAKTGRLVRGHAETQSEDAPKLMPDARAFTIWDVIRNTVEAPELTLYLVLDEAHRGMGAGRGAGAETRSTIVRQLINGTGTVPGIPVVVGISATVARFDKAMERAEGRDRLQDVKVDARRVQESGLIKDTVILDVSNDDGNVSTVLLRRGADKLREMSLAWADYARSQRSAEMVLPLMVLQVPNTPDPKEVGTWLDIIFDAMPELQPDSCVANVFGEHRTEIFGRYSVPYVEPQRVQDDAYIRILIAKDAISTGWDCPRAEVMVSLRPASDHTYITQLLGRMVRTPLARRIPGNDRLNAVDCILPLFDRKKVEEIVAALTRGGSDGEGVAVRRVLIRPVRLEANPAVPEEVWAKLLSLPSQNPPRRNARPVQRLTWLGHELAYDGFVEGAGEKAHRKLHAVLDGLREELASDIAKARRSVLEVEGKTVRADVRTGAMSFDDFVEAADMEVIDEAFRRAQPVFSRDVARSYVEHLAGRFGGSDETEALQHGREVVAAMAMVPAVAERLDAAATRMTDDWLRDHRSSFAALPDERREKYREIQQMSPKPTDSVLVRPRVWERDTVLREADGRERPLDRLDRHLLSDAEGLFPVHHASSWEASVLSRELRDPAVIGWYRNPGNAGPDSLGIAYNEEGDVKIMRPDFIFFARLPDGSVAASIVDPHDHSRAGSLERLQGLARYAASYASHYHRIDAVAELGGTYRVLDLTSPDVRKGVGTATSAASAYAEFGRIYSV